MFSYLNIFYNINISNSSKYWYNIQDIRPSKLKIKLSKTVCVFLQCNGTRRFGCQHLGTQVSANTAPGKQNIKCSVDSNAFPNSVGYLLGANEMDIDNEIERSSS